MLGESRLLIAAFAAVLLASAAAHGEWNAAAAVNSITVPDLQSHLGFLASDALEGREAGQQGGRAAVAYIIHELQQLNLEPAGEQGAWVQEFGSGFQNVLGLLPGTDPEVAHEIVLLGAHLDHVGRGSRSNTSGPLGLIYNGADDNASGVSALLEIAEGLALAPPRRSVLFAFWDAEEKGLLGSKHWTRQPTRPLKNLRLAFNLDMVGRMVDDRLTVYGSRTAVGLRSLLAHSNRESDLRLNFDLAHRDDSDHYSFFAKNVPYLMLFTGDHPDYHRPSDDVQRINFEGLQRISQLVCRASISEANAAHAGGFRTAVRRETRIEQLPIEKLPPRLGIAWTANREPGGPIVIEKVTADSPAGRAGLRPQDRVLSISGTPAEQIGNVREFVLAQPRRIEITIERSGVAAPGAVPLELEGPAIPEGCDAGRDPADPEALIIRGVRPGSPAAISGLQAGDRLWSDPPEAELTPVSGSDVPEGWTIERQGRVLLVPKAG